MAITTIYFTKKFLSGCLKGLEHTTALKVDSTRVPAVSKRYRVGKRGTDCITKHRWIITDASFQNYSR